MPEGEEGHVAPLVTEAGQGPGAEGGAWDWRRLGRQFKVLSFVVCASALAFLLWNLAEPSQIPSEGQEAVSLEVPLISHDDNGGAISGDDGARGDSGNGDARSANHNDAGGDSGMPNVEMPHVEIPQPVLTAVESIGAVLQPSFWANPTSPRENHSRNGSSHNRSGAEAKKVLEADRRGPPKPTPAELKARIENVSKEGGWKKHRGVRCSTGRGSGRFPDGGTGDGNGSSVYLDDCLKRCQADEFCDAVVVEAGKLNGPCNLRAQLTLSSCSKDNASETWLYGSVSDRVHRLRRRVGWELHERSNCYEGAGSGQLPAGTAPRRQLSDDEATPAIALDECLVLCQETPLCDGVVVSAGAEYTKCHQRAWVNPTDCREDEGLELWTLGAPAEGANRSQPPTGGDGRDRLMGVVDMVRRLGFRDLNLTRCALVGASASMGGQGAGAEIDGHTAVIRVNRLPTDGFYEDFGERTDFLFLSKDQSGEVAMMGGDEPDVVKCRDAKGCDDAAIIVRSDQEFCDLGLLAKSWGSTHPMVGCQHANVSRMVALGFSSLPSMLASTGMQAFFTFLPVCGELTLYGFGGFNAADGRSMWKDKYNLYDEHVIQGLIADGRWDEIPWNKQFSEAEWLRTNAAKVERKFSSE